MDRLEEYASLNNIPIMQKDGILFLTEYIKENNVKRILEIGSAIGYSACKMALVSPDISVVTVERDETRYKEAVKNIHNFGLDDQIEIILGDALETEVAGLFDLIFIDNLNFHGLTLDVNSIGSKNLKALVRKINNYKEFLVDNKEFQTEFLELGDGIGISKRV